MNRFAFANNGSQVAYPFFRAWHRCKKHFLVALLVLSCLVLAPSKVKADPIIEFLDMLGPGAIDPFLPPQVIQGNGTIDFNAPTIIELPNGFQLIDFSYTITPLTLDPIVVVWEANRDFELDQPAWLRTPVVSSTAITPGATPINNFQFGAAAGIDMDDTPGVIEPFQPIDLSSLVITPPQQVITITDFAVSDDGQPLQLNAGQHRLKFQSRVQYIPSQVGSQTMVASLYQVTALLATPEPSTFVLATLGLVSLGMTRRRRRR